MDKEVTFLGFKFTALKFTLFFFGWMIFLGFVWPLIIGSYLFMSIFVCGFSVIFVDLFNRMLVLFSVDESRIRVYQNFMLVITAIVATLIYTIWIPMNFYIYTAHLAINIFSVFLMFPMFYKKENQNTHVKIINIKEE
ncbi:hypothetical protein AR687_00115 [Flavobacteriaceae bacterium CRH]|nr:hypothetical protein AR687_00115 [Flavobacteriaceae bacterium CRH]